MGVGLAGGFGFSSLCASMPSSGMDVPVQAEGSTTVEGCAGLYGCLTHEQGIADKSLEQEYEAVAAQELFALSTEGTPRLPRRGTVWEAPTG